MSDRDYVDNPYTRMTIEAIRADERRRVVDELWTFLDDLRLPGIKAAAVATKLNEMRGDDG